MQGTNAEPGLIPRTLDYLFDSLKATQNSANSLDNSDFNIFKYKPDKFNEIVELSDCDYNAEMSHKAKLLKLSGHKDLERCESYQALNEISATPGRHLSESKKFGSLDSLASTDSP